MTCIDEPVLDREPPDAVVLARRATSRRCGCRARASTRTSGAPVAAAAGSMTAGLSKNTTCWSVTAKSCMSTGRGMSIGTGAADLATRRDDAVDEVRRLGRRTEPAELVPDRVDLRVRGHAAGQRCRRRCARRRCRSATELVGHRRPPRARGCARRARRRSCWTSSCARLGVDARRARSRACRCAATAPPRAPRPAPWSGSSGCGTAPWTAGERDDVDHAVAVERELPALRPRELGVRAVADVRAVELGRDARPRPSAPRVELVVDRLEIARVEPPGSGSTVPPGMSTAGSIMLPCLLGPATPDDRPVRRVP